MSIAEKELLLKKDFDDVYEAGKQAEYDKFWDNFQDYGNRKYYNRYPFSDGWNDNNFNPKYVIVPYTGSAASNMFQGNTKITHIYAKHFDFSQAISLSQTENSLGWNSIFRDCTKLEVIEDVGFIPARYYATFNNSQSLRTIEKIRVSEETTYYATFANCFSLENIGIEGVIGQNFDISPCPLTVESLKDIINCLKDYTGISGTWTVTLGETNLAKLTNEEKAIATDKGWILA